MENTLSQVFTFPSVFPASGPSYHPQWQPLQESLSLASCELREPRWGRALTLPKCGPAGWGFSQESRFLGSICREAFERHHRARAHS